VDNPEHSDLKARLGKPLYLSLSTDSDRNLFTVENLNNLDLMTAAASIYESYGPRKSPNGWTDDALEQLPEGVPYEIEDGRLVVSPSPAFSHQRACARLLRALEDQCTAEWWPIHEGDIRIYKDEFAWQLRTPDILVVPRGLTEDDAIRGWAHPHEVPLVIEVVSPSSLTVDRMTKVSLYASWGIPLYLRLERKPDVVLYSYELNGETGQYAPPTEHRDVFTTDEPFPLRLDLTHPV
jgi:Uma2 family endonuclease